MIDSSVWIDFFSGNDNAETEKLNNILGNQDIAIGDLILAEVLQGFKSDNDYKVARELFKSVSVFELLGADRAIKSAENFRFLRKKGITIRKTTDVIIASFCIDENLPLLFSDRDFEPFEKYLGLLRA